MERIVVRCSALETGGAAVVIEGFLAPDGLAGALAPGTAHELRFEVVHGELQFELDGATHVATAGDRLTVPRGTAYRLWNPGGVEAQFVCEARPALDFEQQVRARFITDRRTR
jgi:glyoxylate utilization-related uncharacterized protein